MSGNLPFLFLGRKYCTYICSTMYWPLGSSLVCGPPGWRTIMRTSLPLTSTTRPPTWNEPMPRSTMSSSAAAGVTAGATKNAAAASAALITKPFIALSLRFVQKFFGSVAQAFFHQPVLNERSDLVAVLVHHHHVRVALDARIRQVDQIET